MLTTFRYQLLTLLRDRSLMIWTCAFPIILATIFGIMFGGIEDEYAVSAFRLGVLKDENLASAPGLDLFLRSMAGDEEAYLDLSDFEDEDAAAAAVRKNDLDGYLTVDEPWRWYLDDWAPHLHVSPAASLSSEASLNVARAVIDAYVHMVAEFVELGKTDPSLMLGGMQQNAFFSEHAGTTELVLTKTAPNPSARYYYALLGMACGLAAMLAISSIRSCQATMGALGARRTLAALPRWRVLVGSLVAAWVCSFAALLLAFLYLLVVIRVDFGGTMAPCLVAIALASLMSCAMGAFLGTFAHMETGIVSGISCLLSLFTGLYGTASQRVADATEAALPWLSQLNPLWHISSAFYALLYYDSLEPFAQHCLALLAMTGVFGVAAALRMRRMSHEHL